MISQFVTFIETLITPWGALGVFIGSIIEEVIAIIPSSVVQMGAGFLLLSGQEVTLASFTTLVLVVAIPAAAGVTIGSLLIYAIAYYAGKPAIEKYGKYFTLSWHDVERIQNRFSNTIGDELIIFIGRALPIMPTVAVTAFAGVFRIKLKEYLVYTFLGTLTRALILGFAGWQAGRVYYTYAEQIDAFEDIVWLILAAVVIIPLALRFHLKRKKG